MNCPTCHKEMLGLNGPPVCPSCARERTAESGSDAPTCSRLDYERSTVCRLAEERGEFVTDVDGFVYWWPSAKPEHAGHLSPYQLRILADELDRRNAPWQAVIDSEFSSENPRLVSRSRPICKVCGTPGCIEMRGSNFHEGRSFGSKKCDYTGTPPFADAEWAGPENDAQPNPFRMCEWCAGTGHPHGDESYGMCECPALSANAKCAATGSERNAHE